ncbi:hypothetical protein GGR06_000475 [Bacteroides reticulotermitis]|uniref:Uncharacterized protein n=1 Tax=Bacteroides reticulotermitis TaxID=1133319 RepID=A0A840CS32_9BACE|nr:hypothetical protein [Bacteroides reticulotermitis]
MLYSMYFKNNAYICSVIKKQDVKPLFKMWGAKKEETNYEKECK